METLASAIRLRQILMRLSKGLSERSIARDLKIGRNQLRGLKKVLGQMPETIENLLEMTDTAAFQLVEKVKYETERVNKENDLQGEISDDADSSKLRYITEHMDYYTLELKRPGVTLLVLYEEYVKGVPEPYSYSFFCRIIKRNLKIRNKSYHRKYNAGEHLLIDFAGDCLSYVVPGSGEVISTATLICTLAYSNYTYVEVLPNATTGELIKGLNNALIYFGGVPSIALSDNMKQWVIKSDKYEPIFSTAIEQWANHNGILLQAARVRRPKDKSPVERHVSITYTKIYAPLRNETFFSVKEINTAVRPLLYGLNNANFQSRTYSRYEMFMEDEKPLLSLLPSNPFTLRHYATLKVQASYHIYLSEDRHYYSVPHDLVGETVEVIYNTDTVEIFHKLQRKAVHVRNYTKNRYTTNIDHMPLAHKYAEEMFYINGCQLLDRAKQYGDKVHLYIKELFNSREDETHGYKSALAILNLGSKVKYGKERLGVACSVALEVKEYSYRFIKELLSNKDSVINIDNPKEPTPPFKPLLHENLRGIEEYKNK